MGNGERKANLVERSREEQFQGNGAALLEGEISRCRSAGCGALAVYLFSEDCPEERWKP